MILNGEVVKTGTYSVEMTQKEYEAWRAIQAVKAEADRSIGQYGFVLVRFSNGHIMVHNISAQPERTR